ncbi:MAG: AbrB/MazE/SpoVT family DNA-binding domain-containing protein [Methanosarcinales archaeon]
MTEPDITIMGEKCQVVIPKEVRKRLSLKPKTRFMVFGHNDTVILKKLVLPDLRKEWERLFKAIDRKGLKITEKEIQKEIETYRKEKYKKKR